VGSASQAVAGFQRSANGTLTWIGTQKDPVNLSNTTGIAISPDGTHIYASAFASKTVVVFERKLASGLFSSVQVVHRAPLTGTPANPALDGAREIVASADGKNVYVAAHTDDRVVRLDVGNPAPSIDNISPASVPVNTPGVTIDVYGACFMPTSTVRIGAAGRATTYIDSGHLTAVLLPADLNVVGNLLLTVFNLAPGGGTSNSATLVRTAPNDNPVPVISQLSPESTPAGGPGFTLTVNGTNFIASSKVRWNGSDRATTFVSATKLQATLTVADIKDAGEAGVTVFTPLPGGGSSNAATFIMLGPGENPEPVITDISPSGASTTLGTPLPGFTIDVYGLNFIEQSTVQWDGANRATSFVDSGHLQAQISAGDLATSGIVDVTVVNPAPGGGTSNPSSFTTSIIAVTSRTYIPLLTR
jgi:hypothetical protein